MRKLLLSFCLVIFCLVSFGQVYQEMPQYGYRANRMAFDSTLQIPTVCGVPTLKSVVSVSKKAAIAFDSCNNKFYKYNPKTLIWSEIGSTLDTTSLSNRINLKVNISDTASMLGNYLRKIDTLSLSNRINLKVNIADTSAMLSPYLHSVDTANRWIQSITRIAGKDSIIFYKGGVRFAIKDSVGGGGQNGRFGNDTATIVMVKVHNDAGVTLTNGKVVALTTSGNNNEAPAVRLANSKGDSTSANTLGFVSGTIANQDTGWVILSGKIEKLNTSAFSNGDIIYLDTISGNYTKVKPQAPTHLVYLGVVVKSNAGNGAIFVKCQNGYELDEIHDVQINSKLNNQVLAYSDTQKVWKNKNIYSIVDTVGTIATKTNVALKVNISDTAAMLSKYVEYADTSTMLTNYVRSISLTAYTKQIDTIPMFVFGAGSAAAGDTSAFTTSAIYGSFYNDYSDTINVTSLRIGLQGTSPSINATVYFNDSLGVTAGATKLVIAGSTATNIYTGTLVTSLDNTKIPQGNWVWVQTGTVTTKPTYFTLTLFGNKLRR